MNSRKDSRIKVGKIVSAVGIKGEVKVYPYTDYPQRFEELDCVYAGDEKLQIEKVRYQKNVVIVQIFRFRRTGTGRRALKGPFSHHRQRESERIG